MALMIHTHDPLLAPVEFTEPVPSLLGWGLCCPDHASPSLGRSNGLFGTLFRDLQSQHVAAAANRRLTPHVEICKIFPAYVSKSVQRYVVPLGKCCGIPKGPESGRLRCGGGRGSVVGNVASTGPIMLLRSGKEHKQRLFSLPRHTPLKLRPQSGQSNLRLGSRTGCGQTHRSSVLAARQAVS